jgi:hypothetical protein
MRLLTLGLHVGLIVVSLDKKLIMKGNSENRLAFLSLYGYKKMKEFEVIF